MRRRWAGGVDLIRGHRSLAAAVHCAFDLLEVDGEDLRRQPIEARKQRLAALLRGAHSTIVLNEHYEGDGAVVYQHACALGCEGIVSKRLGSPYRSGRSPHWVKVKNPAAPAVRREAEEDCGLRAGPTEWPLRRLSAVRLSAIAQPLRMGKLPGRPRVLPNT